MREQRVPTSLYVPPRPNSSFRSAARQSPPLSSSILDGQSAFPVHTSTCSEYPAIAPLSGPSRSKDRSSGIGGVAAHPHVGSGHVGTVLNGGGGGVRVCRACWANALRDVEAKPVRHRRVKPIDGRRYMVEIRQNCNRSCFASCVRTRSFTSGRQTIRITRIARISRPGVSR